MIEMADGAIRSDECQRVETAASPLGVIVDALINLALFNLGLNTRR